MTNTRSMILAEMEWDEGLSMPIANAQNKQLEEEIQKKQTTTVAGQNECSETEDRIAAMREHLKNVRQELQYTQALVNARENESQTEDHMLKIAQREEGRLKQEISRLMKEMDELKERKNMFENNIFKQTRRLEDLKSQMNWDQKTLESWLEESTKKDEDAMTLQKYTRHDDAKIRELSGQMEKLMAEVMRRKHNLHMELTTTTTSQIELDKCAEDFRRAHNDREDLLYQWESTIEQMQKRDREMEVLASKLATARQEIRTLKGVTQEKCNFLEHEMNDNAELEKRISVAERHSSKFRMEVLQAELQKTQFENETYTLKRTVDRTALDLELARAAIVHYKKDITDRKVKLELARNHREELVDKLKAAVDSTLSAGEKATRMDDMLLSEEKKQEELSTKMKRMGDYLYKREREFTDAKVNEKRIEANINGAHNTIKNLNSQIHTLDSEALKQQEIQYGQDFTLQQLERRCMRMQGDHNTEEKSRLEHLIMNLHQELDLKVQANSILATQSKKVQDDIRSVTQALERMKKEKADYIYKIEELNLYNEKSEVELKKSIYKKQSLMVEENLLKLRVKKLQECLNSKADDVLSKEKRKLQLNTAMKERHLEIKIHKEMLIAQVKTADDERQQISAELHERISKIDKMKKRYEILTISMLPPDGEEEKSQAYYVIKAAQQKEELQREGDDLDARIRKAEKEIRALENTLKLMNGRNEQYRKSFNKITESCDEMDEKHNLDEQLRAVMDKYKYKKRQLCELQDDLHTMSTTLGNLAIEEESYTAAVEEKKAKMMQLLKDESDQQEKLERVTKHNNRLSRNLRVDRNAKDELPEERDFRVRQLRDFNTVQAGVIHDAIDKVPEMFESARLYFEQANLPPLSDRSSLSSWHSVPGSVRGSAASSRRSSSRSSSIKLAVIESSSSSSSTSSVNSKPTSYTQI